MAVLKHACDMSGSVFVALLAVPPALSVPHYLKVTLVVIDPESAYFVYLELPLLFIVH